MKTKIGIYEKAFPDEFTLEEKFAKASELGYDFVEICIDTDPIRFHRLDWTKADCDKILEFTEKYGLEICTFSLSYVRLHPLGLLDENRNKQGLDAVRKTIEISKNLGVKTILLNAYDVYGEESTQENYDRMIQNFKKVAEMAEAAEIVVGLENAEMPVGHTVRQVGEIVKEVNSPYVKIYADIANSTNAYDGDTTKVINELIEYKDDLVAIHIKDNKADQFRDVVFGEGRVEFKKILDEIRDFNIQSYVYEYFNQETWEKDLININKLFSEML